MCGRKDKVRTELREWRREGGDKGRYREAKRKYERMLKEKKEEDRRR